MVLALLEDKEAVANLDAILAVPGVDVYFIGPADLARPGHPGRPDNAEVQAAIDTIIRKTVRRRPDRRDTPTGPAAKALHDRGAPLPLHRPMGLARQRGARVSRRTCHRWWVMSDA